MALALGLLVAISAGASSAQTEDEASEPSIFRERHDQIALRFGSFNFGKGPEPAVGAEVRFGCEWNSIHPVVGFLYVPDDESTYTYAGFNIDFFLSDRLVFTTGFAAGVFDRKDGKDLGGPLEFKTSLELGYVLNHWSRLALTYDHISNAGIYDRNPGADSIYVSLVIEPARLWSRRSRKSIPNPRTVEPSGYSCYGGR